MIPPESDGADWLARFHTGERAALEQCYRDQFASVLAAAARILSSVDAETVAHEVFYRLLADAKVREAFRGGNLRAWLVQIGTNAALDCLRRKRRETPLEPTESLPVDVDPARLHEEIEAKVLVERFCRERLPSKWHAVFEARFLRQLPQRDAARELRMPRTSLVYQEQRIRALLEEFLLDTEGL